VICTRGTMRQRDDGAWILEVMVSAPTADLLLADVGAALSISTGEQTAPPATPAALPPPASQPAQSIGNAGAGDSFTLGGARPLSAQQQAAVRYMMALVSMPPFQLYAAQMLGVSEPVDAQQTAQEYVMRTCPQDLLSDVGVAAIRNLHTQFQTWWASNFRHELTFNAECP